MYVVYWTYIKSRKSNKYLGHSDLLCKSSRALAGKYVFVYDVYVIQYLLSNQTLCPNFEMISEKNVPYVSESYESMSVYMRNKVSSQIRKSKWPTL